MKRILALAALLLIGSGAAYAAAPGAVADAVANCCDILAPFAASCPFC